jgi:hypothetical protein
MPSLSIPHLINPHLPAGKGHALTLYPSPHKPSSPWRQRMPSISIPYLIQPHLPEARTCPHSLSLFRFHPHLPEGEGRAELSVHHLNDPYLLEGNRNAFTLFYLTWSTLISLRARDMPCWTSGHCSFSSLSTSLVRRGVGGTTLYCCKENS